MTVFPELNFPPLQVSLREEGGRMLLHDPVRRKWVAATPEEWVRQHTVRYLAAFRNVPPALLGVEKQIKLYGLSKRFDIVVFSRQGEPLMLAECKAPSVNITESVFDQAARYNLQLNAGYFLLTNGLEHYSCRLDHAAGRYVFLQEIPDYSTIQIQPI